MVNVKREGREGVYLVEPVDAIALVKTRKGKIHNIIEAGGGAMQLGASWDKRSVIKHLEEDGVRIALITAPNRTMGHQLVAINNEGKRHAFDVGEIGADDLNIV